MLEGITRVTALRILLEHGRFFADSDNTSAEPAVVINRTMAKQFWPNQDPNDLDQHSATPPGRLDSASRP